MQPVRHPTARLWIATPQGGFWVMLNYSELAEGCGLTASAVSRYFARDARQRRRPSLRVLTCLAKAMDVTLDQLAAALENGARPLEKE